LAGERGEGEDGLDDHRLLLLLCIQQGRDCLQGRSGILAHHRGVAEVLEACTFSCGEPASKAARSAGMAWCRANPTSTSMASTRPAKPGSLTARVSSSKTVRLPPSCCSARATVARNPVSVARRYSTRAPCSVALFTFGSNAASVVRRLGSADFSAFTNGAKSVLSGFLSIRRANTVRRVR